MVGQDEDCPAELDKRAVELDKEAARAAAQSADNRAVWLGRCLIYFRYSRSTEGRFGLKKSIPMYFSTVGVFSSSFACQKVIGKINN